jgi:hypothetical protein
MIRFILRFFELVVVSLLKGKLALQLALKIENQLAMEPYAISDLIT